MTEREFKSKMALAETMRSLSKRTGYYEGYVQGLRRLYHGAHFGTLQEHEKWLGLAYDTDRARADQGRGYLDGLQGIRPRM
jgi:hypothetical protein